jgi:peptidoglycan/xylan/chitin deacetylase (PgdA/CDA1 family)
MMPLVLRQLSPAGPRGRLSTLIFHRVLPEADPLFPQEMHAQRFDELCAWLRNWFQVLPLHEACQRLRDGSLPERALAITFDDGYADNHEVALPILQRHGLNATFFIATGFLNGGRMWNDTLIEAVRGAPGPSLDFSEVGLADADGTPVQRLPMNNWIERRQAVDRLLMACKYLPVLERQRATESIARLAQATLPQDLMMQSSQVQALHSAGMGIGGHTVNHPILARLDESQAKQEMLDGKSYLESLLQAPVTTFAYPNGRPGQDYLAPHPTMARELGFEFAVTTAWGVSTRASDPHQLPRFTPWDSSRWAFGVRMARNLRQTASARV